MRIRWSRIAIGCGLLVLACVAILVISGVMDAVLPLLRPIVTTTLDGPVEQQAQEDRAGGSTTGRATNEAGREATAGAARAGATPPGEAAALPPFKVLTLAYTPYMATLALMDARGYLEERGYDLQLVDVYSPETPLNEEAQCAALKSGEYPALATTLNTIRRCGQGTGIAIPIGQSAGGDAIVVKPGIETWNDVFEHAVAFTGFSVSEFLACFASHSANQPVRLPLRFADAGEAVDAWINAGAEQDIQSVVAWEPEVARALQAVPGSRVILSSRDVRNLWDVVVFSEELARRDPAPFAAFTRAYYRALRDLSADPQGAFAAIQAWAEGDPARQALVSATSAGDFTQQLDSEAFATLRDAAFLMDDRATLRNRLEEAKLYWEYCGISAPAVEDEDQLLLPDFVLAAREDSDLLGRPDERPSAEVFQITDFTNAAAVTDAQIEQARVLFQAGVNIEFVPNRTDFRNPTEALTTLQDAVRFLRTCQDCVLEVQGGAAYPGERVCPGCRPEESDKLAVDRGRRVVDELHLRFDVPEAQLRFVDQPHAPQFPGSNNEEELRQDRRTFLAGYQLSGR